MHLLHSAYIQNWFHENFDIIFISETHLTKGQIFEIPDFVARHNAFSTVDDVKARGGVSCFIAREYLCLVKSIMTDIPENIVINFKNGDAVFGSYIPPQTLAILMQQSSAISLKCIDIEKYQRHLE